MAIRSRTTQPLPMLERRGFEIVDAEPSQHRQAIIFAELQNADLRL